MPEPPLHPRAPGAAPPDPSAPLPALAPYRDDRASLAAENARLRAEIARLRRRRVWPAVAAIAAYLVILTQLGDWLNGTDPVRYWVAVASLGLAFCVGAASAIHLIVGGRG